MRILRGLTSRLLACGCIAGVYETYDGAVVTLLDERGQSCTDPSHVPGNDLPELTAAPLSSEVALQSDRQRKS